VGAGESRNIGIFNASNEWISFLDVDDYYYDNRFIKAVNILKNTPDAEGIYEAVENVFENHNAQKIYTDSRPNKDNYLYTLEEIVPPHELFKVLMAGNKGFFHLNGVLIKKMAFEKVGYFDKDLELSQDTDVLFKIAMISKLYPGSIDKPVAARLVHDGNRMFSNEDKLNFFRVKSYFNFSSFAQHKNLDKSVLKIIEEKNIKLCASKILGWNIYRFYRVKYFYLKSFYPWIMKKFFIINNKKYMK